MKDEMHIRYHSDNHTVIVEKVEDWIDYYNNDRPQWVLAKLTPSGFYQYTITGIYPLPVPAPKNAMAVLATGERYVPPLPRV